jgi:hypothetical protein
MNNPELTDIDTVGQAPEEEKNENEEETYRHAHGK